MNAATHKATGYRATRKTMAVPGYDEPGDVLIVHDVEFFCACERDDFGADELWLKAAVAKALDEARGGYHPPLHIRHHEPGTVANDSVRRAGWFEFTGVRPITMAGKRRNAMFADLYITDEWAASEVLKAQLPYRSVEIFDVDAAPSIDGLALLDHEAPYLPLPMLMISEVDDQRGVPIGTFRLATSADAVDSAEPVVAFFRHGRCVNPLHQEADMATKPAENKTETFGTGVDATVTVNMQEDDKPKDDDDNGENSEGDEGLDVSAVVKAIESGEISVADMDAILAAIQAQGSTQEPEPEVEAPAPAAAPGAEAMKKMSPEMAAMQGRIDGLEAKDIARDETAASADDVRNAFDRLKDRPLGANLRDKLVAFRKAHGSAAFSAYVDSMEETTGVMPTDDGKGARFAGQIGTVPEIALKYQGDGTDAVDKAAGFAREWEELQGSGLRLSLESYVQNNMKRLSAREA